MNDNIERFNAKYAGSYLGDEWVVRASDFEAVQSELTATKAENEVFRGRIAELEHLIRYAQVESGVCMCGDEIESHNQASGHNPVDIWDHASEKALEGTSDAWLLRKQAEALDEQAEDEKVLFGYYTDAARRMRYSSQRLRTQAEAAEKGGDDD